MGLFDKKNTNSKVVWRDRAGKIVCPGDSCPKECDDSCPIFLNTQAAMMMRIGQSSLAIPIYEEALAIAPDFYDAWNNLGGIYGEKGDYKKAYDCYLKARELNKEKPNPVYGLMLTSKDLKKYDECLSWCDVYKTLSNDGREKSIRNEVNKQKSSAASSGKTKPSEKIAVTPDKDESIKIVKQTEDGDYMLIEKEGMYFFVDDTGVEQDLVSAPGGAVLKTSYRVLAERILDDIQKYGLRHMSAESILPWHYTMCDNFSKMKHKAVEDALESSFLQNGDWTFLERDDEDWEVLFGTEDEKDERLDEIREWLKKCTHMQMTAACCIGNAYRSLNLAFVLAAIMENYSGGKRQKQFRRLARMIELNTVWGPAETLMNDFLNFELYYGIHLEEEGAKINKPSLGFENDYEDMDERFREIAQKILDDEIIDLYDPDDFFNVRKLSDDIIAFCKNCYKDLKKQIDEFFISAYYDAVCLTIHHIQDEDSFTKDNAYQFLLSKCDTEFCDIYSDRLFGYQRDDEDSNYIWDVFHPYMKAVYACIQEEGELTEDILYGAMASAIAMGISVAYDKYEPEETEENAYIGKHVDITTLVGRNYYHYVDGVAENPQPLKLATVDIEADDMVEDDASELIPLSAYIAKDCWVKKVSISEDEYEANRLVVLELDNDLNISNVTEIIEESHQIGGGMFMVPGATSKKEYVTQDSLSDETEEELELLLKKRVLPDNFSFVGKKLPQEMIDEGNDDTSYSVVQQSAYRLAYMDMSIDTSEDGVIDSIVYSTYQSTGSGYWDMFSRPQHLTDKHEEIVDMLLHIVDAYTDEEYEGLFGKAEISESAPVKETENSNEIILYKDEWKPIIGELKERLCGKLQKIESSHICSDITVQLITNHSLNRENLLRDKFEEAISFSNSDNVADVYKCCQWMVDLCQVMDYGPAGAWLGLFCEEVLEDYSDAAYWYNKAASFGEGIGMYRVGLLYLNKKVEMPSYVSLKRCFTDAVEHGVKEAQKGLEEYNIS